MLVLLLACTSALTVGGPANRAPHDPADDTAGSDTDDTDDTGGADTDPADSGDTDGADTGDTDTGDTDGQDTAETGSGDTGGGPELAEWTVLVFVNGDNDLEGDALVDVNEMETVGSTDDVNVLVQLDRSARYSRLDGDWSGTRRYRVEADSDAGAITSPVLADLGTVDSAAPETIADFVAWGAATYPARQYALVIWDHGDGWSFAPGTTVGATKAVSYDYGSGNDLSVAGGELVTLLSDVSTTLGGPLDLLGMDACLMQSWEVTHVAAPYAHVYVGSQDYEDVTGWDYDTTLADLVATPTMDASALAQSITLRFHEIPDSTQSGVDLDAVAALDDALDALAGVLLDAGEASLLSDVADGAQGFDGSASRDHDLGDLLDLLAAATDDPAITAAVADAQTALAATVFVNYTYGRGVSDATGLSIFSPPSGRIPSIYQSAAWSTDTRWTELVTASLAGR